MASRTSGGFLIMSWQTVIGLEVHVQLKTKSKLFSNAPTTYGARPNAQTNFVDAGLPGVLPVLNEEAVHMALMFGLAIDAQINNDSYFERKNYFYPDLPKGYQISQYKRPIVGPGHLKITLDNGADKIIHIDRAHLEEDAGKSIHDIHYEYSAIDLNRAGTPLLEIVTTPCMSSAHEAVRYLKNLHQLVKFLGICDGNLQEGSFRCDVNLSVKKAGDEQLGVRTEIKNLNSFRYIEKAIEFEINRHIEALENGDVIIQETRLFSPEKNATFSMRGKESDNDYRYFPDPDLLPIHVSDELLTDINNKMPKLPADIKAKLTFSSLHQDDIDFILSDPAVLSFYESVKYKSKAQEQLIINWLKGPVSATLNENQTNFDAPPINSDQLAELLNLLAENKIVSSQAKKIYEQVLATNKSIMTIIQEQGFDQTFDSELLKKIISQVIENHPNQVKEYLSGKEKLLGFFVGQVMKQTKGKANPSEINKLVIEQIRK